MAVKIRLKRMGKIRAPFYRVVVMDSRTKRDGRAIEEIGKYHPTEEPSLIDIDSERAQYWLGQGAQPTEAVEALFKVTGDWQKFKGEAGSEGTLKDKAAKPSKKELYEAAVAAAGKNADSAPGSTTARRRREDAAPAAAPAADASTGAQAQASEEPIPADDTALAASDAAEETPVTADTDSSAAAAQSANTDADASAPAEGPDEAAEQ